MLFVSASIRSMSACWMLGAPCSASAIREALSSSTMPGFCRADHAASRVAQIGAIAQGSSSSTRLMVDRMLGDALQHSSTTRRFASGSSPLSLGEKVAVDTLEQDCADAIALLLASATS